MPVLFRDYETRSTIDLGDVGPSRYACDPTTEVLCLAYAVDDGPIRIWLPGVEPIPKPFITAARNPKWFVVAHGDGFESAIEDHLLSRYGWPHIPIERHRCTMSMALAFAYPASLEGAAEALGLPIGKDLEGRRVMLQMAKPRRPRKGEDHDQIHWHDDPERRERLARYCANDIEVERQLFARLPPLSPEEQALWTLDAKINRRGFHVDLELALAAQKLVHAEQEAIDIELAERTDGRVTSVNQVAKLQAEIQGHGHKLSGLTKKSVAAVLAHDPSDEVRELLELRKEGSQAAPRKLGALIAGVGPDHRVRDTLKFHGASTGRWAGNRFQPQNLKKPTAKNDLTEAIEAIRSGDLACVRSIGAPLALAGDLSRSLICAAPGNTLIGADFSSIESRILAWLAGETWKLGTYQKFDATGDLKYEVYCATASRILQRAVTPEDEVGRTVGKTCDLAFGYGGGLGAWRRFDSSDTYSDAQVESFKAKWRTQHARTVAFWHALEGMLRRALRTKQRVTLKNLAADYGDGNLYLILPSGRRLTYPEAHFEPGKFGKLDIHKILLTDDVLIFRAKVKRFTLGRWPRPRAIKLWPAIDQHLFVGEGIETTLAAATRFDYYNAPILPAWAAGSGSNLARFPVLPNIKKLVLLVDHDANGEGEKFANTCARVWRLANRKVERLQPPEVGMDFNDMVWALEHAP
jgi:Toprim domain-containing protein